jgi:hypothetical protein
MSREDTASQAGDNTSRPSQIDSSLIYTSQVYQGMFVGRKGKGIRPRKILVEDGLI